jgi:hypothetical protein
MLRNLILLIGITLTSSCSIYAQNNKFEVLFSVSESFRILDYDKSDSLLNSIAASSYSEDEKVNSFNIGFRYRVFNNTLLSFKAGLDFSGYGFMDKRRTGIRWPSEITSNGYVFDPTLPHEIQTGSKRIYMELPLIGEVKKSWGKWTPNFQLELVPQYLLTIKSIMKTDLGIESSYTQPLVINNRFNLAFGTSIGCYYTLTEECSILVNGFYRRQLFGIIDSPISAKLYAFGLNAGVNFDIN